MSSAFFLPVGLGNRFCIHHPGEGSHAGLGIVYAHPFGEEMNKSRRMAALQSRRLAAAGHTVLQIDLFGCGDSSGDFVEARWDIWKADLRVALDWLRSRVKGPIGLWGLRLGALLVADVAREPELAIERLILWQPVASGEQHLTQFLRLRLAAEMLSDGAAQSGVGELRKALRDGVALEIAGYDLHPKLAAEMDVLRFADMVPAVKRVDCFEVSTLAEPKVSAATQRALDAWRLKGIDVHAAAVRGESFWSTLEITECETLLAATEDRLALAHAGAAGP